MAAACHKVLIVDDERVIAGSLTKIFSKRGYEARAAYSAEQAFEIIAEWLPDLAIIDVILPRMNGIDLAILLKLQYPTCSLLLFSGETATENLLDVAATKGHTFEILAKPVLPSLILEIALQLLIADKVKRTR